ncbi:bifunctional prephenate dehydrogenase/3-phosphoshikimate 1-carboxyvinyltransferase [Endozoicomonadaceae bacterium StTr2]
MNRVDAEAASVLQDKVLLVVGLGLIGGSVAASVRSARVCRKVLGYDANPLSRQRAPVLGVVDKSFDRLDVAVAEADIIMLAVPMLAMESVLDQLSGLDLTGKTLTDGGSCKGEFVAAARRALGDSCCNLVPGHPIAGSEQSGITAARDGLFRDHMVIVTPLPESEILHLQRVKALWQVCGARVLEMPVDRHDDVLAMTSHLPHLLAFSLVDTLAANPDNIDIFRYAAGGFRDFTRIAASDPTMWHDIFLSNKTAVLSALDAFSSDLERLRQAVAEDDTRHLLGVFSRARAARTHFSRILEHRAYIDNMSSSHPITWQAANGGPIQGELRVPGDKSISHRSIMMGSLAEGTTHVSGFLEGEDSLATLQAFRDMGVVIEGPHDGKVTIYGVGLHGLQPPPGDIYLGNAGTGMRLFSGLMAGQKFDTRLTGDESLSGRPMKRVTAPLKEMGAVISADEGETPPLAIEGGKPLQGIEYDMPMASAQVKSCLLLAGLYADGKTTVTEPAPTRDHTERMLQAFGCPVEVDGDRISVSTCQGLKACDIDVPADISSAAFFLVAASIVPGSDLRLMHVGLNPTRDGVINILRQMGASITVENERMVGGEPVADLRVQAAPLHGIEIPQDQVPLAIDEFPVLFIAAACAEGKTVLRGAEELRVKESDRIQSMANGLQALGVETKVLPDGIEITGGAIGGGTVDSYGDHRIAMAFAVAALRAEGTINIHDCANVATSFPKFSDLANGVGFNIKTIGSEH